jgi:tetratricopeptide (TPR) repeat protein
MDINKNNNGFEESELISRISKLPVHDVPEDLTRNIMRSLPPRRQKQRFFNCMWQRINHPFTLSINPLYAVALVVIICSSFMLGRISTPNMLNSPAVVQDFSGSILSATDNPRAAHLLGRGLLAAEEREQALEMLHNAASLEPNNPEYAYWEGVGYWVNNNQEQERNSYLRGLSANPNAIPLLRNLGHNYLSDGKLEQALKTYQSILKISPTEPSALYNVGLIYRKQNRVHEEVNAWKNYLATYRTGHLAFRAVKRLNSYGIFSYRTYRIGARSVILSPEILLDPSASSHEKKKELSPVISILKANPDINLEVVTFSEHDTQSARERALEIKTILTDKSSHELGTRIALSWLDSPELTTVNPSSEFTLADSILLFSSQLHRTKQEISI